MDLTLGQQTALEQGAVVPVLVGRTECVLIRKDLYERAQPLLAGEPLSIAEQRHILREVGRMAGWDDPEMSIYDELDPRRP